MPPVIRVALPDAGQDAAKALAAARDRVRGLSASERAKGVVVELASGIWTFRSRFLLSKEDSGVEGAPIVWRGAPDGSTVFRFSEDLPLSAFGPVTDAAALRRIDPAVASLVRVADISAFGIAKPAITRELHLVPLPVPELFCDGVRLPTARWPNSRADEYPGEAAWTTIDRILSPGSRMDAPADQLTGGTFTYKGDRPSRWATAPRVLLQGYWCFDWWESTILADSISTSNKTIHLKHPHISGVKQGNPSPRRWRALHLLEELDVPGEYYVDFDAKKLYVIPPESARRISIAYRPSDFVTLQQVRDFEFRDVVFEEGYATGLVADGIRRVVLEGLRFRNLRQSAIYAVNAKDCAVRRCDVDETGRGGITVAGGDRKTLAPGNNVIEDCRVRTFARYQMCYANGLAVGGVGNVIRHCQVSDAPHQAVSLSGNNHVFEYNVVSNVVNNSDDAGGIYKGRNPSCRGNVIRYNCFYDIGAPRGHGTAAIYFDDGDVGECVEGNLFVRCGQPGRSGFGTIFSHGGFSNVVRNCVFVDCKRPVGSAPWDDKRWYDYMHEDFMLERLKKDVDIESPAYLAAYPDFKGYLDNPPPLARDNVALSNVVVNCTSVKSGRWVTNATTVVYASDPGFRDAAHGDYSLKPDSCVFRDLPGFADIPYDRIGLLTPRETKLLSAAVPVWVEGREAERNLTVGFRVRFSGKDAAFLRYSASSIARVWLNGEFLCYGPARGPHGLDRVDVIPLAGRLRPDVNTLAFEVAGYNVESFYLLNERAYLAAEVVNGSGKVLAATRSAGPFEAFVLSERVQKVPRFSYQRPFCEVYSLKPGFSDWRTDGSRAPVSLAKVAGSPWTERLAAYPDYSVSRSFAPIRRGGLKKAKPAKMHEGRSVTGEASPLRGYPKEEVAVQPVYEIQRLQETDGAAFATADGYALKAGQYLLLDHGLCDTGFLGATVTCEKPGRLYFYFDEVLVDGNIDVARMGWQCVNAVTYDFTEPGRYAVEAFEPNTFRYLKVMSDGFVGSVSNLFVRAYKNGLVSRATFESSDPKLNAVFAAARETFAQNAVDVLTDCPSRERAGWLCDSFFSSRSERWLTGTNPVERCFLDNFARTGFYPTKGDEFMPMCYPADAGLLPNWNFWFVFEIEEYLKRTGDRAMGETLKPKVRGIVESFRKYRNADGLLEKLPGWVFIEWSKANDLVQDVNYPSNMTYAKMLDVAARLYGWTDCAEEAERVRETVRRQSWTGEWFCDNAVRQKDGTLKLSGECTETCQYYAFFMGLADAERYPDLWNRLVRDFGPRRKQTKKYPQIHFANAFIGNYLRLELLAQAGLAAQIIGETRDYFVGMAERTGTLWEHDNISNSCDHGFASHVAVLLYRDVLGVASVDPLAKTVVLRVDKDLPLAFCRGTLPLSDRETLSVEWRKVGGEVRLTHVLPAGWTLKTADAAK